MTDAIPEPVTSLSQKLCHTVYAYIGKFNDFCEAMNESPTHKLKQTLNNNLTGLLSYHQEFLRLGELVSACHDTLEYPEKYNRVCTPAISMGTNSIIKAGRAEAFEDMCRLVELVPLEKFAPQVTPHMNIFLDHPIQTFKEDDLREVSYLIPGQHSWILLHSQDVIEKLLSLESFGIVLESGGSDHGTIDYGTYGAFKLGGQSMSGIEFSHLSEKTKIRIVRQVSKSNEPNAAFYKAMDDLLHSRVTLTCLFLRCLHQPFKKLLLDSPGEPVPRFWPPLPSAGVIGDRQLKPATKSNKKSFLTHRRSPRDFRLPLQSIITVTDHEGTLTRQYPIHEDLSFNEVSGSETDEDPYAQFDADKENLKKMRSHSSLAVSVADSEVNDISRLRKRNSAPDISQQERAVLRGHLPLTVSL